MPAPSFMPALTPEKRMETRMDVGITPSTVTRKKTMVRMIMGMFSTNSDRNTARSRRMRSFTRASSTESTCVFCISSPPRASTAGTIAETFFLRMSLKRAATKRARSMSVYDSARDPRQQQTKYAIASSSCEPRVLSSTSVYAIQSLAQSTMSSAARKKLTAMVVLNCCSSRRFAETRTSRTCEVMSFCAALARFVEFSISASSCAESVMMSRLMSCLGSEFISSPISASTSLRGASRCITNKAPPSVSLCNVPVTPRGMPAILRLSLALA
mmetsp:Transcript_43558/g.136615  ORF Transcript_43558/g.136615 Transcript_43558/m.136615 type:complete len:271 (+) Transcript_43558:250-1062(+)